MMLPLHHHFFHLPGLSCTNKISPSILTLISQTPLAEGILAWIHMDDDFRYLPQRFQNLLLYFFRLEMCLKKAKASGDNEMEVNVNLISVISSS